MVCSDEARRGMARRFGATRHGDAVSEVVAAVANVFSSVVVCYYEREKESVGCDLRERERERERERVGCKKRKKLSGSGKKEQETFGVDF